MIAFVKEKNKEKCEERQVIIDKEMDEYKDK